MSFRGVLTGAAGSLCRTGSDMLSLLQAAAFGTALAQAMSRDIARLRPRPFAAWRGELLYLCTAVRCRGRKHGFLTEWLRVGQAEFAPTIERRALRPPSLRRRHTLDETVEEAVAELGLLLVLRE